MEDKEKSASVELPLSPVHNNKIKQKVAVPKAKVKLIRLLLA
ncbi:hypothetical protein [Adhaeribacter radiodurans]|nr:hypothetical protein [Adhaeribacter radiodurans]